VNVLVVLNDGPYGSERCYNGLRLAGAIARRPDVKVNVFLIGDAAVCAKSGQKVPPGYYNVASLLATILRHGGQVGVCGTCMDARGLGDTDLVEGASRSSMEELTGWTLAADRVITF